MYIDQQFMLSALSEARLAYDSGEVPIGAVIVKDGRIIARGRNSVEGSSDASLHAEMVALKKASEALGTRYLDDCVMYVTMEPCPMCAGACLSFRLGAVVFGAYDERAGAFGSVTDLGSGAFGHEVMVTGGIMREACASLLTDFFKQKR